MRKIHAIRRGLSMQMSAFHEVLRKSRFVFLRDERLHVPLVLQSSCISPLWSLLCSPNSLPMFQFSSPSRSFYHLHLPTSTPMCQDKLEKLHTPEELSVTLTRTLLPGAFRPGLRPLHGALQDRQIPSPKHTDVAAFSAP